MLSTILFYFILFYFILFYFYFFQTWSDWNSSRKKWIFLTWISSLVRLAGQRHKQLCQHRAGCWWWTEQLPLVAVSVSAALKCLTNDRSVMQIHSDLSLPVLVPSWPHGIPSLFFAAHSQFLCFSTTFGHTSWWASSGSESGIKLYIFLSGLILVVNVATAQQCVNWSIPSAGYFVFPKAMLEGLWYLFREHERQPKRNTFLSCLLKCVGEFVHELMFTPKPPSVFLPFRVPSSQFVRH